LVIVVTNLILKNNQVKEDEMGRACSTKKVDEECIWDICGKDRRKETNGKTKT
jgi:hypothetical protein